MMVSVSVNVKVKDVKEFTVRGFVLGVILKVNICGIKFFIVVVQLSI